MAATAMELLDQQNVKHLQLMTQVLASSDFDLSHRLARRLLNEAAESIPSSRPSDFWACSHCARPWLPEVNVKVSFVPAQKPLRTNPLYRSKPISRPVVKSMRCLHCEKISTVLVENSQIVKSMRKPRVRLRFCSDKSGNDTIGQTGNAIRPKSSTKNTVKEPKSHTQHTSRKRNRKPLAEADDDVAPLKRPFFANQNEKNIN